MISRKDQKILDEVQRRRPLSGLPLVEFATKISNGKWTPAPHLKVLAAALEKAATHKGARIILCTPPRHGKSEMVSRWFPVWFLDKFPDKRVILASYESDYARSWGRKVRDAITANTRRLSIKVSKSNEAADEWGIEGTDGGMITAGTRGPITGRGGDVLIIDDPVKDREDADSEIGRDRVWNWWTDAAYTRLEPNASVVIVMTRWHEDDLVGRLLSDKVHAEKWEVIRFPARAEEADVLGRRPGDPLWPERYNAAALDDIQETMGPRGWNALYQQRPTSPTGEMFQRDWWMFWRYADEPEHPDPRMRTKTVVLDRKSIEEVVQSWDLTFKDTEGSDLVAGGLWGRVGIDFFLLDLIWERLDFPGTQAAIKLLSTRWLTPHLKLIEDKANGPAIISSLRKEITGLFPVTPKESKRARAASTTPMVMSRHVFLPLWHSKTAKYIDEHASFPEGGAHDDVVDQQSQMLKFWMNRTAAAAPVPKPTEDQQMETWWENKAQEIKAATRQDDPGFATQQTEWWEES